MRRRLAIIFVCGCLAGAASPGALRRDIKIFRVTGERATDGTLLIEPMLPPALGVTIEAGKALEKRDVLNCTVEERVIGQLGTTRVKQIFLTCGETTLAIKGIVLR